MKCPNPTCRREVANASAFCPYCGSPMRRVPRPALIAGSAVVAIVAVVAVFIVFRGLGGSSASSLPEPFEGTIEVVVEDAIVSDFTVQGGQSTWMVEDPLSGGPPLEISAALPLVAAESGAGVYDYDLEGIARGDLMASTAEEIESAFGSSTADELLLQSQVQLIIPVGAAEGDIVGTWGIRYEEGGLFIPIYPYPDDGAMSVINELTLDVKRDGTFSLVVAFDVVGGEGASAPEDAGIRGEAAAEHEEAVEDALHESAGLVEYALVYEGSWYGRDIETLTFRPETGYRIVDTVPTEPEPVSDFIPPVYVGVMSASSAGDTSSASVQAGASRADLPR